MIGRLFPERLGAEVVGPGKVRFTVWAPFADAVTVEVVSSPPRLVSLAAMGDGYHQGEAESLAEGARYYCRLHKQKADGKMRMERWPDPASRFQPDGVHGPSQVTGEAFDWRNPAWPGIPLSRYIVCEIHVGTFTPEGTFDGITGQLDRLKDAGFTALELMPVGQFPGSRNWGYDGVYPFAVQNSYGGPEGLKRLVDACHGAGLAVILDVVYNHLGPEGNYIPNFGPYFTDFYRTPWGEAVNFDGPHSDPVRRFFTENALQWVDEYRIDALRIDAVHAIYDFSARPFLQELARAVEQAAEVLNRRIYCIAESALNDARVVRPRHLGGLGLHAQWNDDFHHALHTLLTGEREGYYQDYGRTADMAKAMEEGFVYSGAVSAFRKRRYGNSSRDVPASRLVVFSQNHDQIGNRLAGERLSTLVSLEKQKLAAAVVLLSPFIPLLFMGEEYGETAPFPYFVSHSDPALVKAVREGRQAEFSGFRWEKEPPDPQDEATFRAAIPAPSLAASGPHRHLLAFHRKLVRLRKTIVSLSELDKHTARVETVPAGECIGIHRWSRVDEVFAVFRFGDRGPGQAPPMPAGKWRKRLDSADAEWAGPGSGVPPEVTGGAPLPVPVVPAPHSAVLFYRKRSAAAF